MDKHVRLQRKVAAVAFGLLLVLPWMGFSTEKGPRIAFKEESWSFGKVKEGEMATHVFVFQNTGDAPLVIKRVRTSCGCAAALVSEKTLPPGQKGELKVSFNSRGYEGNVAKYVYVESNDAANPVKQLVISADVQVPPRPKIDLERYSVDAGLILEGEEIPASTVVRNTGEKELVVSFSHRDAEVYHKGKKIGSELRVPAGKEARVDIKIPPRSKKGLIREYILLKSNDNRRPNLSLFISGYVITKEQLKELFAKYKDLLNRR
ncbi:MAG: DUF1573 domain-containing protein [Candidatus Aminicenantales bacterium]